MVSSRRKHSVSHSTPHANGNKRPVTLPHFRHFGLTFCPLSDFFPSGLGLVISMVLLMISFAHFRWCAPNGLFTTLLSAVPTDDTSIRYTSIITAPERRAFSVNRTVLMLFACNFIGICCARSLHFQFYVWYYHTLPFLLWSTRLPTVIRLLVLLGIELAWNPWEGESSSPESAALLTVCHVVTLLALWDADGLKPRDDSKTKAA